MGRTIHYSVADDGINAMTDEEWSKIEELQEKYNDKYTWTCENLCFERLSVHPNWTAWRETGLSTQEVWNQINQAMEMPKGLEELQAQGLVEINFGGYQGNGFLASGFTKVRENEENAALVIKFLIEASLLAPRIRIKVSDEGDYLACPVIIQNGRMKPDESEIKSSIEYWKSRASEGPADQLEFWIGLIAGYKQYLGLGESQLDNSFFIAQQIHC
jgi:hypothetical protein